jgi:hypothetical protein
LLGWGGKLHRLAIAGAGVAVGVVIGGPASGLIGIRPELGILIAAVVLGLVGLIGAPKLWALLFSLLGLAVAVCVLAASHTGDAVAEIGPETFEAWAREMLKHLKAGVSGAWHDRLITSLIVLGASGGVPLLVALIRPKLAAILMTSLLGACGLTAGALLGFGGINEDIWTRGLANPPLLALAVALLMLGGLIVQYTRVLVRGRKEAPAEEEPAESKPHRKAKSEAEEEADDDEGDEEES